jgi:hypothetical protein
MPSEEWRKQLNPDSVVPGDAMSEEQTFRSEVNGSLPYENLLVPIVPNVLNGLNGLNVLNPLSCR